jgi:hypothetical protein
LLAGGLEALEHLFPGFGDELRQAGAVPIDPGLDMLYEVPGQDVWPRIKFGRQSYAMSRPLIERTVRRQVQRLTNVNVEGGCRVLNIVSESNAGAATGIRYQTPLGGVKTLQSDLIIDASGNGSLTVDFLKASGRRPPEETSIGVNLRYASTLFERSYITKNYKIVFTLRNAPEESRGGLIVPAENDRHQVVLSGRGDEIPPITGESRLNFQRGLGRLAVRDTAVFELLTEVRHLLKPPGLLNDPSIARRIEEEIRPASELLFSSAE